MGRSTGNPEIQGFQRLCGDPPGFASRWRRPLSKFHHCCSGNGVVHPLPSSPRPHAAAGDHLPGTPEAYPTRKNYIFRRAWESSELFT
jgi:hypothetical protein